MTSYTCVDPQLNGYPNGGWSSSGGNWTPWGVPGISDSATIGGSAYTSIDVHNAVQAREARNEDTPDKRLTSQSLIRV